MKKESVNAATAPGAGVSLAHRPARVERLIPVGTWLRLLWSWAIVGLFMFYGKAWLESPLTPSVAIPIFILLFGTIIAASFGVVKEADHLAHALGEPFGTLILTLSIVAIEVILIASVLLGPTDNPTIGRDSIFAVMMIILNLVMGICLLAGGVRYGEQEFNTQGATAYISMIILLTGTALVLPNYTSGAGEFAFGQAVAVSALTAILYGVFLTLQMGGYRRFFMQPSPGELTITPEQARTSTSGDQHQSSILIDKRPIWIRSVVLVAMILPIVLLAHDLAIVIDYGIGAIGAPVALGGVLIAIIVFTPESLTAIKAARNNEMQRAINLCLGAFVSTVGLTVPAVLVIGLFTGRQVLMGISATGTVLFVLTTLVCLMSFNGQRTSPIQGLMHIVLFVLFGYLLFAP